MVVILFGMSIWAEASSAREYRLLELDRLDFEYSQFDKSTRDPYVPEYTGAWRDRAALDWDLQLLEFGYWRNKVHTETAGEVGIVRTVGWKWEAGVEVGKYFDLFRAHHSRHVMEKEPTHKFDNASSQFPVEDSYGVRFHLYRRER